MIPALLADLGEQRAKAVAELALDAAGAAGADEAEAVIIGEDSALTRFASNYIHQNVAERNVEVRVRAFVDGRAGVAATNEATDQGLRDAARRAVGLARLQPEPDIRPGLPDQAAYPAMPAPDAETATATPEWRAEAAASACQLAASSGAEASGAVSTALEVMAVGNSRGVWAYAARSRAQWVLVVTAGSGAGYSEWVGTRAADLDATGLAAEATERALASRDPVTVEPGDYPVVLEPYATATLVSFLGAIGFSGLAILEGRSFLSDRRGECVADPLVTIRDDPGRPGLLPLPFDFEGVPRRRVDCLVDGVGLDGVWDRASAARAGNGRVSTGHALPAPNPYGPAPLHLVLEPGRTRRDDLMDGIERGLLITRFHYVRTVQPKQSVITGLTRDGTFLIERGRAARPVKNLRFTQSILDALGCVTAVGDDPRPVAGFLGSTLAPSLAIGAFRFTGAASH